jgi:hypothetical protein
VDFSIRPTGRSAIDINPDGEIAAVDVERDVHILDMQVGPNRIVKPSNFATSQNKPLNGAPVA